MKVLSILLVFFPVIILAQYGEEFDKYFIDKTMRIDYLHIGDNKTELVTIDHIYQYGMWAGSRKNLLDNFNNGQYYAKIYDVQTGHLLFSKGFDTIFGEYQTSKDAINGIKRSYHESVLIPYPKNTIKFTLERRDSLNTLHTFFEDTIDPQSVEIIRHEYVDPSVEVYKVKINGNPHRKIDVVLLAEGYTEEEKDKFKSDIDKMAEIFFNQEPYKSRESDFNIYAVFKASPESGIDEPRSGIYKQTTLNATFNSLGSERYLLTEDNKTMRDLASHVPYDAIYIMINHHRYGGGGIYNLFCTFTADNQWFEYLFLHEFGHSFAGLADEYYGSPVAYSDFYPKSIEPTAPNITALLDKKNIKWQALLSEDVPIPTPWNKKEYDQNNFAWQELRKKLNKNTRDLKRQRASVEEITAAEAEYDKKNREASEKMNTVIQKDPNRDKVGAFEGAGYASTGLYRSMADCIMFSVGNKPFCKVCAESIDRVINHYLE